LKDASHAWRKWPRPRPSMPSPIAIPPLVISTTRSRLPLLFIHSPRIVSDSPPLWPGTKRLYTSAVSMALNPASRKASSNEKLVALSAVQPKTFPPRTSGAMFRLVVPSLRISIGDFPRLLVEAAAHFGKSQVSFPNGDPFVHYIFSRRPRALS